MSKLSDCVCWVSDVKDVSLLSLYEFGWIHVINFEYVDRLGGISGHWVLLSHSSFVFGF